MHNEFHPFTKVVTFTDPDHTPERWGITEYKVYQGHQLIPLSPKADVKNGVIELLQTRSSKRDFSSGQGISFGTLSTILKNSIGETDSFLPGSKERKRRVYPSAGARYPCETYILITKPISEIGMGLFHYRPDCTSLELLDNEFGAISDYILDEKLQAAEVYVFITAVVARSTEKYGTRGYRFCHLEAGAMAQNISLVAASQGCGTIWIGGTNDEAIERLLDIDGEGEVLLLSLALRA